MQILTSYFYQIRFFKPWHIPFSTALWDPKWYHDFRDQSYNFLDKRGVLNGLRIKDFRPGADCQDLCRGTAECVTRDPNTCDFLQNYEAQLMKLDPDRIEKYFITMLMDISNKMELKEVPVPILIVHEAPTKLCSERVKIQKVLNSMGFDCHEWQP